MEIPEWFCSVVCAGLNMDDIVTTDNGADMPQEFNMDGTMFKTEEE